MRTEELKNISQCLKCVLGMKYLKCLFCRATFDEGHIRGYIDMFLIEQKENRGKYFTDDDLIINCQVRSVQITKVGF